MAESKDVMGLLWTEKYRPVQLADMALAPENRAVLQAYLDAGEIPHLLLLGPAGSGKTTVAKIICRTLDCRVLALNASKDRGIDVVRQQIGSFVTAQTDARWNICWLDEADHMTTDAQTAMRNQIESYAARSRFILTGNYGSRIIGPIQSRCQVLHLDRPPLKERYRILERVLKAEGITADTPTTLSYVEKFPDLRQTLMQAQRCVLSKGKLEPATSVVVDGAALFANLIKKDWRAMKNLTTTDGFEAQPALRELFYAVPDDHPRAGALRHIIGRGVHETGFTPDPHVLFLGVVAEAMECL